jgi:benzodiazapine receptor
MKHDLHLVALAAWIALCLCTGAVGAVAAAQARTFYAALDRPSWSPPGWVFGPVWTTLFVLMGTGAWTVWRERGWSGAQTALALFCMQLVLNALWSWLFFAWHRGGLAFAEVLLLALSIAATMVAFGQVRTAAALLLLPYLAWVSFASVLNYSLWRRNPTLL